MKALACALLSLLALSACKKTADNTQNPVVPVAQAETASHASLPHYRVVAEIDAPFSLMDEKGLPTGFDVELLNAMAKKQGFTVEYSWVPYAEMFESVATGRSDVAISGIYITPARLQRFDFSEPYMETGTAMVAKKPLRSFRELADKRVSVKAGTVAEKMSRQNARNGGEVKSNGTHWLAFKELLAGNSDVMLGDAATIKFYVKNHKESTLNMMMPEELPKEYYAFVVKKGDAKMQKVLNDGLVAMKKDGTYDRLYRKWFE